MSFPQQSTSDIAAAEANQRRRELRTKMRLVARFLLLGAMYVAGVLVIVVFAKPNLPGFLVAGGIGVVLVAALDRLRLSRFLGRPPSDQPSSDIRH